MYYMNTEVFTILIYYTISKKQLDACTCNNLRKITMYNYNDVEKHIRKVFLNKHFMRII